ncbi:MAG: hypothetical protein R3E66_14175 [bacterium]
MNLVLWILQVLLALHTVTGAVWKFSNSEQVVPALSAIPHGLWLALIGAEFLCGVALLLPAARKSLGRLAPIAAVCIATEMLLFCGVSLASPAPNSGELIYWVVVAGFCAFLAYGRFVLRPIADTGTSR